MKVKGAPMQINRRRRVILLTAVGIVIGASLSFWTTRSSNTYLSTRPSVSQTFVAIPNEQSLIELCYRINQIQGVTGVSYRDYSMAKESAVVTVYYNPRQTSIRQLRIFLQYTRVLWAQPART
jgi:hypothetical protein